MAAAIHIIPHAVAAYREHGRQEKNAAAGDASLGQRHGKAQTATCRQATAFALEPAYGLGTVEAQEFGVGPNESDHVSRARQSVIVAGLDRFEIAWA